MDSRVVLFFSIVLHFAYFLLHYLLLIRPKQAKSAADQEKEKLRENN